MIRQFQAMGFPFEQVLADRLYGESKVNFVNVLDEFKLPYMLALRSNHALWLPQDQEVSQEPWPKFERTLSHGTSEVRSMAAVLDGKRHCKQDWLLTTDPAT
jgi:SRSO17 transposase